MIESMLRDKSVDHLERNSLIRPSQLGFMAGRDIADLTKREAGWERFLMEGSHNQILLVD